MTFAWKFAIAVAVAVALIVWAEITQERGEQLNQRDPGDENDHPTNNTPPSAQTPAGLERSTGAAPRSLRI